MRRVCNPLITRTRRQVPVTVRAGACVRCEYSTHGTALDASSAGEASRVNLVMQPIAISGPRVLSKRKAKSR